LKFECLNLVNVLLPMQFCLSSTGWVMPVLEECSVKVTSVKVYRYAKRGATAKTADQINPLRILSAYD
jgi:hypothetical protein